MFHDWTWNRLHDIHPQKFREQGILQGNLGLGVGCSGIVAVVLVVVVNNHETRVCREIKVF